MRRLLAGLFLAAVALTACDGGLHVNVPIAATSSGAASTASAPLSAPFTSPLATSGIAELRIASGFSTVAIRVAPIGHDLFRAITPPNSGGSINSAVNASSSGAVVIITGSGGSTNTVEVVLSPTPRWQISLDAGANAAIIDMTGAKVAGVAINQGVSSLDITLPDQSGTTAIALAAGVSQLQVHLAGKRPAQVTASAGAGSVTIDGITHSGVAAGSSFQSPGWTAAADRVDIECGAGVSSVVVDRR